MRQVVDAQAIWQVCVIDFWDLFIRAFLVCLGALCTSANSVFSFSHFKNKTSPKNSTKRIGVFSRGFHILGKVSTS